MRILDLCCKAGGCSVGYYDAFREYGDVEVIGVDIEPQPNYPFIFFQGDALKFPLEAFDFIHASPPCQAYTIAGEKHRNKGVIYNDILEPMRERLVASGKPYVIENVVGAPLRNPLKLCGSMFGLRVLRHRLFESNVPLTAPMPCNHVGTVAGGQYVRVVGHGGGKKHGTSDFNTWCEAMGIGWMTRKELVQAVPPVYTLWIGRQVAQSLVKERAA